MAQVLQYEWEKLLARWTPLSLTGEVRFCIAVIAAGIADALKAAKKDCSDFKRDKFFSGPFQALCRAIDLDPSFVVGQVAKADESLIDRVSFLKSHKAAKRHEHNDQRTS